MRRTGAAKSSDRNGRETGERDWYLGSLTNESGREFDFALDFLDAGAEYEAQIYSDAPGITWQEDAGEIDVSSRRVTSADRLKLVLAPGGGTAVRFRKI